MWIYRLAYDQADYGRRGWWSVGVCWTVPQVACMHVLRCQNANGLAAPHYQIHNDVGSRGAARADAHTQRSQTKLLIVHHSAGGPPVGTVAQTGLCRGIKICRDLTVTSVDHCCCLFTANCVCADRRQACQQQPSMPSRQ